MKKLLLHSLVVWHLWTVCVHESAARWATRPAPRDPTQSEQALPAAFTRDDYTIKPLARYTVTAVVLSRARYHSDEAAKLAPVDLALGWGPMSDAATINALEIGQSGRWYHYQWSSEPPIPPAQIARHSANTHCVPANATIRRQLLDITRHDLVSLDGYLVEITRPNGWHWRSSLTRDDTEGGSCELLWVTQVSRRAP